MDKPIAILSPFYCPAGEGTLQRQDLSKLFDLIGHEKDPNDPQSGLWYFHLTMRLYKALDCDKASMDRYIELIRQIKSGNSGGGGAQQDEEQLRREMAVLEARAVPPDTCGHCHKKEQSSSLHHHHHHHKQLFRCARCKTQKYCSKACQKAHWEQHRACCKKIKHVPLVDAQDMHRQYPDTFDAPNEAEVREVQPGVFCKVCVDNRERIWVEVDTVLAWPKFLGKVTNQLVLIRGLKMGDRIEFEWKHVYSVNWPWKSVLYDA